MSTPGVVLMRQRAKKIRSQALSLRIPADLFEALKSAAMSQPGESVASLLKRGLAEWLETAVPWDESYLLPGVAERGSEGVSYGGLRMAPEMADQVREHAHLTCLSSAEVVRLAARNLILAEFPQFDLDGTALRDDPDSANVEFRMRRRMLKELAARPDTRRPPDACANAVRRNDPCAQSEDPSTAPDDLAMLATFTDPSVQLAVAQRTDAPPESLTMMSECAIENWIHAQGRDDDEAPELLCLLADNPSMNSEGLGWLANCALLHFCIVFHLNISDDTLESLTNVADDIWEGEVSGTAWEILSGDMPRGGFPDEPLFGGDA